MAVKLIVLVIVSAVLASLASTFFLGVLSVGMGPLVKPLDARNYTTHVPNVKILRDKWGVPRKFFFFFFLFCC